MNSETHASNITFKIINNSAAIVGGDLFYRFANFLASLMIARTLGSEGFGQFTLIYVYIFFFEIFVQFGLNSLLVREFSQNKGKAAKILGNAIILRVLFVLAALPIAWFLVRVLGYPFSVRQGVFLASFQLFLTLRPIYETVFRVNLQMVYPVLWNMVRAFTNLLFVGTVACFIPQLPWFILAYLVSGSIALLGLARFSRRVTEIDFHLDKNILSHLLKESAPLVASACLTMLYYRIDVIMLSLMKDFSAVGIYSAAIRIGEALTVISSSIFASFFPLLSRSFKEDHQAFRRFVSQGFLALLLIGMPVAIGGSLISRDLIPVFFGNEYAPAGFTLAILCWHTFFSFLGGLLANILIGCGRQTVDMWISLILVLVNVGLNFCLIPIYSFNGAALATAVTELVGMIVYFTFTLKDPAIKISFPLKEFLLALRVNLPFLVILIGLRLFLRIPVLLIVLTSIFLYGILLFWFKIVTWKDIKNYFAFSRNPREEGEGAL